MANNQRNSPARSHPSNPSEHLTQILVGVLIAAARPPGRLQNHEIELPLILLIQVQGISRCRQGTFNHV
ncbi:hypothetical protein LMG3410_01595 [Achromobacter aegrifaciens]|uniref:Uncharacterized protein n=1 Tax=Achromobacter mucicolens TaxID=1389922 RepID=A0ABM8LK07_9BURK|nr:hypothetical protein LMG3410_01595 [Achromobacter aegrifaciens]CAB3912609.1 hypothetical protein LMG3415_05054 [Achromobacter mucicolens]